MRDRSPGQTVHELMENELIQALYPASNDGDVLSKSTLNSLLYSMPGLSFEPKDRSTLPRWYCAESSVETGPQDLAESPKVSASSPRPAAELDLYPWQEEAFGTWFAEGERGVVQAVTGSGKTRLAAAIVDAHLRKGGFVTVLVHTHELLNQWKRQLELLLARTGTKARMNLVSGQHEPRRIGINLVIATAQTAYKQPITPPPGRAGLLIADEVHHYGAPEYSKALRDEFDARLGLTATYDRPDFGCVDFLDPYFGGVIFKVGYARALAESVIAPFRVAFVGTRFSSNEKARYQEAAKKARRYRRRLVENFGVPASPFGEFMRVTERMSRTDGTEAGRIAGYYLSAFNKRRAVLASTSAKYDRLGELSGAFEAADRSIIFAQTLVAARRAVRVLQDKGLTGAVMDSTMKMDERRMTFAAFEDGTHDLVAAPQLLDEGVDVPAADLAVVLASSRSKRQMIQRMGRVIRKKDDGRPARFVVLYVEGTSEDPDVAHESFLEEMLETAESVQDFGADVSAAEVSRFLNEW